MRSFFAALLLVSLFVTPPVEARRKKRSAVLEQAQEWLDRSLVKEPQDLEACFSPDEPCEIKLDKFLDSAQKSIDVAIYDINLDELVHELLVKARQIPIRVVVDRKQASGKNSLVPTLIRGGIEIRYGHQRGIMHNKFAIVDGERLVTGSFNFTHHASRANNENQIYIFSPAVVERYRKRFEKIWSEADPAAR